MSNDEDDWSDDGGESDEDWKEGDDEYCPGGGGDLLWLCEEGLLEQALARVRTWARDEPGCREDREGGADDGGERGTAASPSITGAVGRGSIKSGESRARELFRKNADGNTALHEILMGGTADPHATELAERVAALCAASDPARTSDLLGMRPRSHGRTVLHWAAWGGAPTSLVKTLVLLRPKALFARDDEAHGERTPLGLAQRYWPDSDLSLMLRRMMASYGRHRVRLAVHLCARRLFVMGGLMPMDGSDRRKVGVGPRPWFAASVLGYFLQREALGVALNVLSYLPVGGTNKKKTRKRKGQSFDDGVKDKKATIV